VVVTTVLSDATGLNLLLRERSGNKFPWTRTVKIITILLFTPILFVQLISEMQGEMDSQVYGLSFVCSCVCELRFVCSCVCELSFVCSCVCELSLVCSCVCELSFVCSCVCRWKEMTKMFFVFLAPRFNFWEPKTYFTYHQLKHFEILCSAHSAFMCFVWFSEQTSIISPYRINLSVFVTEAESDFWMVPSGSLNQTVSSLRG
jgi:hypothetical protein